MGFYGPDVLPVTQPALKENQSIDLSTGQASSFFCPPLDYQRRVHYCLYTSSPVPVAASKCPLLFVCVYVHVVETASDLEN